MPPTDEREYSSKHKCPISTPTHDLLLCDKIQSLSNSLKPIINFKSLTSVRRWRKRSVLRHPMNENHVVIFRKINTPQHTQS